MLKSLSKPIWKNDLCSLSVRHGKLGNICAEAKKLNCGHEMYVTSVTTDSGICLGTNSFALHKDRQVFEGFDMSTSYNYRNKGYGIGRLMRLISIMVMLKNKLLEIEIFSKNKAIYFHSKYKFEPLIMRFEDRDWALESMAEDKCPELKIFQARAEKEITKLKKIRQAEMLRASLEDTSSLAGEYIQAVLNMGKEEYKNHPFKYGFDMVLTKEKIFENREFFNSQFRESGIDYQI